MRWTLKSRQPFVSGSRRFELSLHVALHLLHVRSRQNLSLHIEVSFRYVDDAEKELQNYVEKFPAQILTGKVLHRYSSFRPINGLSRFGSGSQVAAERPAALSIGR